MSDAEKLLPYVADDIRAEVTQMIQAGANPDLVLTYLEVTCGVDALYDIPSHPDEDEGIFRSHN